MIKKFSITSLAFLFAILVTLLTTPVFAEENQDALYVNSELKKISDPYFLDLLKKTEQSVPKQMSPKLIRFLGGKKFNPAYMHIMANNQLERDDKNYIYVLEQIKKQLEKTSTSRFGEKACVKRIQASTYFQAKEFGKAQSVFEEIIFAEKLETRTSAFAFDILATMSCIMGENGQARPYALLSLKQYYSLREIKRNQLVLNDLNKEVLVLKEQRSDLDYCKHRTKKLENIGFL